MRPINFPKAVNGISRGKPEPTPGVMLMHHAKAKSISLIGMDLAGAPLEDEVFMSDDPETLREVAKAFTELADYQEKVRS